MAGRNYGVAFERSAPGRLSAHPATPQTQRWRRWAKEQVKPRAIDLFAGCGGLSLGLEHAGYSVVLSVDNDPWCLETHRHNLAGTALDFDLSDPARVDVLVRLLDGVPIDLVAGAPPCQPFSRAGHAKIRSLVDEGARPEHDERSELWQSFIEVVERIRPGAVLMENVPDMALGDDLAIIRIMTDRLETAGYEVEARLLDAWRYGVPQHRQRLILVGTRDGRGFKWPASRKTVNLRDAIGDLPRLGDTTGRDEMKTRHPQTAFQRRARKGMNGNTVVWDHVTRPVRDDDREAFHLMKPGTRYSDLPEHLRRYRADIFNDKYNRLAWDGLCRSITAHIAKDGYWYIHPGEDRTLTVREAARVQTFPDIFRFAGTRSHAFRQIGNAVPPALGAAVGKAILDASMRPITPKAQRDSSRFQRLREKLLEWAQHDAKEAPWRHSGDPWQVLAGIVFASRAGGDDEEASEFLKVFPTNGLGVATAIRKASAKQDGGTRKRYIRMSNAARALVGKRAWKSDKWVKAAQLGPAEEGFMRTVGLCENRVLVSAAILRFVTRVTGRTFEGQRRLSDGRMLVGRVVGNGPRTHEVTAAIQALGRVICTPEKPECRRCPVNRICVSRE